jgi:hypothetical protein
MPMKQFLNIAWPLVHFLSYVGLAFLFAGIAIFGWYFIRANANAAGQDLSEIPPASWHGTGPLRGAKIFLWGLAFQSLSLILANLLPGRA